MIQLMPCLQALVVFTIVSAFALHHNASAYLDSPKLSKGNLYNLFLKGGKNANVDYKHYYNNNYLPTKYFLSRPIRRLGSEFLGKRSVSLPLENNEKENCTFKENGQDENFEGEQLEIDENNKLYYNDNEDNFNQDIRSKKKLNIYGNRSIKSLFSFLFKNKEDYFRKRFGTHQNTRAFSPSFAYGIDTVGSEFLGKRSLGSENTDKRALGREFLGKRALGREFLGKRTNDDGEMINKKSNEHNYNNFDEGKTKTFSVKEKQDTNDFGLEKLEEALRKRALGREFLGKRALGREFLGKRALGREFLGKRALGREFLGKRALGREFLGKRVIGAEFLGKRALAREFLGKRIPVNEYLNKMPLYDNGQINTQTINENNLRNNLKNILSGKNHFRTIQTSNKDDLSTNPNTNPQLQWINPEDIMDKEYDSNPDLLLTKPNKTFPQNSDLELENKTYQILYDNQENKENTNKNNEEKQE